MSLTCLENIVTIRGCSGTTPLSGLDLMDAPEVSQLNLSKTATEKDVSGLQLAQRVLSNANILVRNDMLEVLARNNMLVDVTDRRYQTTEFKPQTIITATATERGITLKRANPYGWRKSLKGLTIHTIKVFPMSDVTGATIKIYDSGLNYPTTSTYVVDLVGGEINEFDVAYTVNGEYAHVVMVGNSSNLASAYLTTCAGCSGKAPNDCAFTQSYNNGVSQSGREGYGLGLVYSCTCDYDMLMCNLAKTSLGKLIWMKARIGLMQEHLASNRLNNWIVYNREEVKDYWLPKLEAEYDESWRVFVSSLPNLLQGYNKDCIFCNGIRHVISV